MNKDIEFKSNGLILKGTLYIPESKKGLSAAIYYHGRGSSYKRYPGFGKSLEKEGIAFLGFDFAGCGESEGDFGKTTLASKIEDAKVAIDFLLNQKGVDQERIGVFGVSQGGHIAAMIASTYKQVRSLVLGSPAAYPKYILNKIESESSSFSYERKFWQDSPALEAIEIFKGPLMIIEHELDEVIPRDLIKEYYNKAGSKEKSIYILKASYHRPGEIGSPFREEISRVVVDWFVKTLLN